MTTRPQVGSLDKRSGAGQRGSKSCVRRRLARPKSPVAWDDEERGVILDGSLAERKRGDCHPAYRTLCQNDILKQVWRRCEGCLLHMRRPHIGYVQRIRRLTPVPARASAALSCSLMGPFELAYLDPLNSSSRLRSLVLPGMSLCARWRVAAHPITPAKGCFLTRKPRYHE